MPVIYVHPQQPKQWGHNPSTANWTHSTINASLNVNRVIIFRFSNVPVPKGSTINSATLHHVYSGKNNTGTAYSLQQDVYVDVVLPSPWLDNTKNEWTSPARSWNLPTGQTRTTWNFVQGTATSRQIHPHNVKPHMDTLLANSAWTLAGGTATFLISYASVSNPDNVYAHGPEDAYGPILEINYTAPASDGLATVVNQQENCNFNRSANSAAEFSMEPYSFNDWFGTFAQPTYSILSAPPAGVPVPPFGGKILRVQASTNRPMVLFGLPIMEEANWWNHSAYVFVPSTAPTGFNVSMMVLGDTSGLPVLERGQWVRASTSWISDANAGRWTGLQGYDASVWNSTAEFYVANVQLTKGRQLRPYIDGNRTMTGATYGWSGVNTGGFVRAAAPTISLGTEYDKAARKFYAVNWTYSQSSGHAQESSTIKVKRTN